MLFINMIQRPDIFRDKASEEVEEFMDKFELFSIVNNWGELEKLIILPLFLNDKRLNFLK